MPIYEYQCDQCQALVERRRLISERNDSELCQCGGLMNRVPSLTAFALKGGGWTPKGSQSPAPPRTAKRREAGYDMTGARHDD
jgi:putative FmdB family regulatory protein